MASNSTISIGFKIEDAGKDGFKNLVIDAKAFGEMMKKNVVEAEKLKKSFINFNAVSNSLNELSSMANTLTGSIKSLSALYDTQMEAETRLEQVMRNTMGARQEEIQSIKDFCSAQQQIGVVGDEVQLAGAQELATYLTLKGSLKQLIPVMNDMLGTIQSTQTLSRGASLTDNVASATRLQGSYSLWGQTFYGNNVSGDIIGAAGGINLEYTNEINCYNGNLYLNHRGSSFAGYNGGHTSHIYALINGGSFCIGTSNSTEKLNVAGNILCANGNGSAVKVAGATNKIWLHVGSGGVNRGIFDEVLNKWLWYFDGTNLISNGNAYVAGNLTIKNSTSASMGYSDAGGPRINFHNTDSSQNVSLMMTDFDSYRAPAGIKLVGNQGSEWFEAPRLIATELIYGKNIKSENICIECGTDGTRGSYGNEINDWNGPLYLQHKTTNNLFACTGGGKVGIGTLTPSTKLDVNGTIRATDWVYAYGWYSHSFGGGWYMDDSTYIKNYNSKRLKISGINDYYAIWLSSGGYCTEGYAGTSWGQGYGALNVGIANNSAQTPLLLAYRVGAASHTGDNRLFAMELLNSGTTLSYNMGGSSMFQMSSGGVFWASAGIYSNGYVSAKGQNTSDLRLKTDIRDFTASDIIRRLRPRAFRWNALAKQNSAVFDTETTQYGLIAQETQAVAPWLVKPDMFGDGYFGVWYDKLIPILLQGQKETMSEVDRLKARVAKLENALREHGMEVCDA